MPRALQAKAARKRDRENTLRMSSLYKKKNLTGSLIKLLRPFPIEVDSKLSIQDSSESCSVRGLFFYV